MTCGGGRKFSDAVALLEVRQQFGDDVVKSSELVGRVTVPAYLVADFDLELEKPISFDNFWQFINDNSGASSRHCDHASTIGSPGWSGDAEPRVSAYGKLEIKVSL